jgi:MFS family permease
MNEVELVKRRPERLTLLEPLKKSRNFSALWIGQLVSFLGDSITSVVLPLVVYSISGSTVDMGIIMALFVFPQVLVLPFAGVLVDVVSRVKLMMFSDIVRFGIGVTIAALAINGVLTIPWLCVCAVLKGAMDAIFQPAYSALRAQIFTPDIRNAANSLSQIGMQSIRLLGPSIGGLLLALLSAGYVFGIDSLTFLISIVSLMFLKVARPTTVSKTEESQGKSAFFRELAGGYFELKKHPWLWITIVAFAAINVCTSGIIGVILPWLINVHYGYGASVYGVVVSASGVGALLGGIIYGSRKSWPIRGILAYAGIGLEAITFIFLIFTDWIPGLVILTALGGLGSMFFGLIWETSLQELVPEEAFGRVASLDMMGSIALMPLGFLFTGWLAEVIGGLQTALILAAVMIVLVIGALSVPAVRRFK